MLLMGDRQMPEEDYEAIEKAKQKAKGANQITTPPSPPKFLRR